MATGPGIDYEVLQQDAMRGVVRAVLKQTAATGALPGDHHFYISFLTQGPGVIVSKRLREKYPQEMTIVLQHRFWDLIVTDVRFEVKLTFDGIPERLVVPFAAIKVFIDPSVRFGLQFDDNTIESEPRAPAHALTIDAAYDAIGEARLDTPTTPVTKRPRAARKPKAPAKDVPSPAENDGERRVASVTPNATSAASGTSKPADDRDTSPANVVSLDQFRKK